MGTPRGSLERLREPADAGLRDSEGGRGRLPATVTRPVREAEATVSMPAHRKATLAHLEGGYYMLTHGQENLSSVGSS
jgi:hypothetical protein